jgi:hypothetical protein
VGFVALDRVFDGGAPWETRVREGRVVASCEYAVTRVEIYNTVVRTSSSVDLVFAPDFSSVTVRWSEDTDSST